jgi:hypothetical protein
VDGAAGVTVPRKERPEGRPSPMLQFRLKLTHDPMALRLTVSSSDASSARSMDPPATGAWIGPHVVLELWRALNLTPSELLSDWI